MTLQHGRFASAGSALFNNATWQQVYAALEPHVQHWVYTSGISSWRGQEKEVIDDIVQTGVTRTFEYGVRVQKVGGEPLRSPQAMAYTITRNYYNDLRRREGRLTRIDPDESLFQNMEAVDLFGLVLEQMYLEWLFARIAVTINGMPPKQRQALLIDLANRSSFCEQQTPLERALLAVGICLRDYRQPLSSDPVLRGRHAASLTIAYQRLRLCYGDRPSTKIA